MTDTPRVFLAAYHDGLSPRYEVVPEGAMGAEEFVPKGAGVKVKALEWNDFEHVYPDGSGKKLGAATGHFGISYAIYQSPKDGIHVIGVGSALSAYNLPSVEAAKAAAQADYEARIRAALDLTTEPEPTSGVYDLICCTAEDVATGRGFTGDAAADLAMAQESLRACLKLLAWRG